MADLSKLNAGEREALRLLAEGHTAKSIAAATGRSVGAVNERLREARRKTGAGSSRELARMLAAQENRDKQIGMSGGSGGAASLAPEAAGRFAGGTLMGLLAMTFILAAAAAAAALLAPQTAPAPDPMLDPMMQRSDDPAPKLHAQLRAEARDAAWAPGAEAALRTRYAAVAGVAADRLRVICAASLCEVAGVATGDPDGISRTMDALQGNGLRDSVRQAGFGDSGAMGFGAARGQARELAFYAYWPRG